MKATQARGSLLVLVLASCAGDVSEVEEGDLCADGKCDSFGPTSGCASADGLGFSYCGGETVCVENDCVAAFPRAYVLAPRYADLPLEPEGEGSYWDGPMDNPLVAPDPYMVIFVDGEEIYETGVDHEDWDADWEEEELEVALTEGSVLRVEVWDHDIFPISHDFAMACGFTMSASLLRIGHISCDIAFGDREGVETEGVGGRLSVHVEPI